MPSKILVVEDDFDAREVLSLLLRLEGFSVITAEDGLAGLDIAQSEQPDLVITDIEMPNLDGIEMIKRLRRDGLLSEVPILVVSASDRRTLKGAIAAGANQTMRKPARFDPLIETINRLLRLSEKRKSASSR